LGERRAAAVKNYLVTTWGITPDRIITRSYGEEQPIAPNETVTGRAKNRRAEVFRLVLSTK
ncbi:MAG: OmpA family protein, partial [Anaerolineales bacterium]